MSLENPPQVAARGCISDEIQQLIWATTRISFQRKDAKLQRAQSKTKQVFPLRSLHLRAFALETCTLT
jgi:hypothetical protein